VAKMKHRIADGFAVIGLVIGIAVVFMVAVGVVLCRNQWRGF
jgi:hypothetical protein